MTSCYWEVGSSSVGHVSTTTHSNRCLVRPPMNHIKRLHVEGCLNHGYPIKHKLNDYDMMRSLMTAGSLTWGTDDEPINHHVHSTTYAKGFHNISVAKSKMKILLGANPCNNENKIDIMSRVLLGSILLKNEEPKDHVMVPQCFQRVRYMLPSSSTRPQVHPITKSQGMESPSPVRIPVRVQLGIQ
jgi:hypothetical protein